MSNAATHDVIKRLLQRFLRDELPNLSPAERQAFEQQFEGRSRCCSTAPPAAAARLPRPDRLRPGRGQAVRRDALPAAQGGLRRVGHPVQLHAAAELYYIYQHERMKVFQVVDVLRRLFQLGRMRIQRGPGARGLYILEKWKPLRYSRRDRMIAYRRAFNYGTSRRRRARWSTATSISSSSPSTRPSRSISAT